MERHRDVFTPDEAAHYLGLPSAESLRKLRDAGILRGIDGWTNYMLYSRADLDQAWERMKGTPQGAKMRSTR